MGKSTYNGTSPYEYIDFLERRNAELEEEVERLREKYIKEKYEWLGAAREGE